MAGESSPSYNAFSLPVGGISGSAMRCTVQRAVYSPFLRCINAVTPPQFRNGPSSITRLFQRLIQSLEARTKHVYEGVQILLEKILDHRLVTGIEYVLARETH